MLAAKDMETSTFPPLPLHHWEILYQRNPRAQIQESARRRITRAHCRLREFMTNPTPMLGPGS